MEPLHPHVQAVAVLNLVLGALWAVAAAFAGLAFALAGVAAGFADTWVGDLLTRLGLVLAVILGLVAILCLATGALLLQRKPAGRALGFVTAAVSLPVFPLGTAFGAYAIWALTRRDVATALGAP